MVDMMKVKLRKMMCVYGFYLIYVEMVRVKDESVMIQIQLLMKRVKVSCRCFVIQEKLVRQFCRLKRKSFGIQVIDDVSSVSIRNLFSMQFVLLSGFDKISGRVLLCRFGDISVGLMIRIIRKESRFCGMRQVIWKKVVLILISLSVERLRMESVLRLQWRQMIIVQVSG